MEKVTYRPCALEHIALIKPKPGQDIDKAHFMRPEFMDVVTRNMALSAWVGSTCLMAAGIISLYKHRASAWAIIGADCGPYMHQITRKTRDALDIHPARRIEMLVDYDFREGHRWAKLLGFDVEVERMRMSGFYGNDETMYVRIKE